MSPEARQTDHHAVFPACFHFADSFFAARKTFSEVSLSGRGITLIISFSHRSIYLAANLSQVNYIFHHLPFFLLQGVGVGIKP